MVVYKWVIYEYFRNLVTIEKKYSLWKKFVDFFTNIFHANTSSLSFLENLKWLLNYLQSL